MQQKLKHGPHAILSWVEVCKIDVWYLFSKADFKSFRASLKSQKLWKKKMMGPVKLHVVAGRRRLHVCKIMSSLNVNWL